jgi:hypothetical protein
MAQSGNFRQVFIKVSHAEFQNYLWNDSYNIWKKKSFVALCKPGFIINQHGCKLEFSKSFHESFLYKKISGGFSADSTSQINRRTDVTSV